MCVGLSDWAVICVNDCLLADPFFVSAAMHECSKRLHDCLAEMYDPEWFGKEEVDSIAEVCKDVTGRAKHFVWTVWH